MKRPEHFPTGSKKYSPTYSERLQDGRERRRQESTIIKELGTLARIDKLTGLPNRRVFDERLEKIRMSGKRRPRTPGEGRAHDTQLLVESGYKRESEPITIIMFDVDNFKRFNDDYGHSVGDLVLRSIGGLFAPKGGKIVIRTSDLVARYGGEEFVLIIEGPLTEGQKLAEKIRVAIKELPISHASKTMSIAASFGVASTEENDGDVDRAVEGADLALYAAKAAGRDQVFPQIPKTVNI
jgi:diguanylate cyclase (GGDEF)-like protein